MALPHSIITLYKEWANSVLCEVGLNVRSVIDLGNGELLYTLYNQLVNGATDELDNLQESSSQEGLLIKLSRQLDKRGLKQTASLIPVESENIVDIHLLLDILWSFILHFTIFTADEENSVRLSQHTYPIGTKLLLQWSSRLLNGAAFDYRGSFVQNMEKDILHNIINKVTGLANTFDEPEAGDYGEAVAEAERKLGVSSNLLRACDQTTEDLAVTIYVSLLRRKSELILRDKPAVKPSIIMNEPTDVEGALESANESNQRTRIALKSIEDQLTTLRCSMSGAADAQSNSSVNTNISSQLSEVPPTSSGSVSSMDQLQLDLNRIFNRYNGAIEGGSDSTLAEDGKINPHVKEFTELLDFYKNERSKRLDSVYTSHSNTPVELDIREIYNDEELDRVSPKSHPTDEGFGTYTKTTPRGKSDSEGTHTDCEQELTDDNSKDSETEITEWWDRIKLPESQYDITEHNSTLVEDNSQLQLEQRADNSHLQVERADNSRLEKSQSPELDRHEFDEDELMCLLDAIGVRSLKSSAALQTTRGSEYRLMHVLKERDDLVLSYHQSLEELSRLTAKITDENRILRQQLNMADVAHDNLFMALEGEVASGRQIALRLQDDLSDTQFNVVTRLRDDKKLLQDQLAALEQEYSNEIDKWHEERRFQEDMIEKQKAELEERGGDKDRENEILKAQIDELRQVLDVTISRTQEECSGYLTTINELQQKLEEAATALTEEQVEEIESKHRDVEEKLETTIDRLQSENHDLQNVIENTNKTIESLKNIPQTTRGVTADITDPELIKTREELSALTDNLVELKADIETYREDNIKLTTKLQEQMNNNNSLRATVSSLDGQLKIINQKYSAMEAVHNLALSQNDDIIEKLKTQQTEYERMRLRYEKELTRLKQSKKLENCTLQNELELSKQKIDSLVSETNKYKKMELDLNSQINQMISEKGAVQSELNRVKAEMVSIRQEGLNETVKCQSLEQTVSVLEEQVSDFRRQCLELVEKLQLAQKEKEDVNDQLNALKNEIESGMANWQHQADRQREIDQQKIYSLESQLAESQSATSRLKSSCDDVTSQREQLQKEIEDLHRSSDNQTTLLSQLRMLAGVEDEQPDYVLHEKVEQLGKQNMEYKFTTSHFRAENSQLQLKVNQLEEVNKLTEERNKLLQKELDVVQSTLDESLSSQDTQTINLLDLSMSDVNTNNDVNDLKSIIQAAKNQVEHLQKKREKANLEYSRKITHMERLIRDRSSVPQSSFLPAPLPAASPLTTSQYHTPSRNISQYGRELQINDLQPANQQEDILQQYKPINTQLLHKTPQTPPTNQNRPDTSLGQPKTSIGRLQSNQPNSTLPNQTYSIKRLQREIAPDSLHLRVEELTGGMTEPQSKPEPQGKPEPQTKKEKENYEDLTSIEYENARLKAEMEKINQDRLSMRQLDYQSAQHDLLNSTLEELERSLDEVGAANKAIRDTLNESCDNIQTNLLSDETRFGVRVSTPLPTSPLAKTYSLQQHAAFMSSYTNQPVRSASTLDHPIRSGSTLDQPIRSSSVHLFNQPRRSPASHLDSQPIRNTYGSSSSTPKMDKLRNTTVHWEDSPVLSGRRELTTPDDRDITSTHHTNRLLQTNVDNYDQLLNSSDNSKSPNRMAVASASKTSDLNCMIRHSLNRLSEVRSSHDADSLTANRSTNGFTYTPIMHTPTRHPYAALDERNGDTQPTQPSTYHTVTSRDSSTINQSAYREIVSPAKFGKPMTFSAYYSGSDSGSQGSGPSNHIRCVNFNDGGPGPYEPKSVLPSPRKVSHYESDCSDNSYP